MALQIPQLVDSRGYQLVPVMPNDNKAMQGMMALAQGYQRQKAENQAYQQQAQDKETMRQAGILAQAARIEDPAQMSSYWSTILENEQDPVFKSEASQLAGLDASTQQNIIRQILMSKGFGNMIPGANERNLGINARNVGYVQDEDGNLFTQWAQSNPNTGETSDIFQPLDASKPNPVGKLTPVSAETLNLRSKLQTKETFEQETAADRAKREADRARGIAVEQQRALTAGEAERVTIEGAKEAERTARKADETLYSGIQTASVAANRSRPMINTIEKLITDPNTPQGNWAGVTTPIKSWLGLDKEAVVNDQVLSTQLVTLVGELLRASSGTKTDFDALLAAKENINSGNYRDANIALLNLMKEKNERIRKEAAIAKQLKEGGKFSTDKFNAEIEKMYSQDDELDVLRKELGL